MSRNIHTISMGVKKMINSQSTIGEEQSKTRLFFVDNLRTVMILFVVFFHAANPYVTEMTSFWPYHDPMPSVVLDIFIAFVDVFNMAILFYIAGYFVLPSIRKGVKRFLKGKMIRIGIPWLLGIVFVIPGLDYVFYLNMMNNEGVIPVGFMEYWRLSMSSFLQFNVGLLNQSEFILASNQFYQRYMWFLSLLLLFFLVISILYVFKKDWFDNLGTTQSSVSIDKILVLFGFLIAIPFFMMDFLTQGYGRNFFTLGNVIQFQPSKLVMYFGFFILGIYSSTKKWFIESSPSKHWKKLAAILFFATPLVGRFYLRAEEPLLSLQIAFGLTFCFLAVSLLITFTSYALKHWNQSSELRQKLSRNSYNIYLFHYIPVNILPLLLGSWLIFADLKWIIVSLATIVICYALSQYLVKPFLRRAKRMQHYVMKQQE